MTLPKDPGQAIDPAAFKEALSRFASGVTVVTTLDEGEPAGLTVSAFCSVSAAPPRVLVCLGNDTGSAPRIERSRIFAVHILGRERAKLGMRFAKLLPEVDDPFEGLSYASAATGAPILEGCMAWLDCRVSESYRVGDHTLFIGAVEAAASQGELGDPVLYFQRAFRLLEDEPFEP